VRPAASQPGEARGRPEPTGALIGEAAAISGIGVHALRYYEREGLITVRRGADGRRRYGATELASIEFIRRLRFTGMPVAHIREYAELVRAGSGTSEDRLEILLRHRDDVIRALEEQAANLVALDEKIGYYRSKHTGA